jgi:hypothetical protein
MSTQCEQERGDVQTGARPPRRSSLRSYLCGWAVVSHPASGHCSAARCCSGSSRSCSAHSPRSPFAASTSDSQASPSARPPRAARASSKTSSDHSSATGPGSISHSAAASRASPQTLGRATRSDPQRSQARRIRVVALLAIRRCSIEMRIFRDAGQGSLDVGLGAGWGGGGGGGGQRCAGWSI